MEPLGFAIRYDTLIKLSIKQSVSIGSFSAYFTLCLFYIECFFRGFSLQFLVIFDMITSYLPWNKLRAFVRYLGVLAPKFLPSISVLSKGLCGPFLSRSLRSEKSDV